MVVFATGSVDADSDADLRQVVSTKCLASHCSGQLIGEGGNLGPFISRHKSSAIRARGAAQSSSEARTGATIVHCGIAGEQTGELVLE